MALISIGGLNMRILLLLLIAALVPISGIAGQKEIVIDRTLQLGGAYFNGKLIAQFEVMTGDEEKPTPPGEFIVLKKTANYHSKKYDAPMPYSLFFTEQKNAIHARGIGAELPHRSMRRYYASHGCVSVSYSVMANWLFEWAGIGTKITIVGYRHRTSD
jgi:lipoprotein-anchoring transpeptidase ErfK/SrfK